MLTFAPMASLEIKSKKKKNELKPPSDSIAEAKKKKCVYECRHNRMYANENYFNVQSGFLSHSALLPHDLTMMMAVCDDDSISIQYEAERWRKMKKKKKVGATEKLESSSALRGSSQSSGSRNTRNMKK